MATKTSPKFLKQLDRLVQEVTAALATPAVQRQRDELALLVSRAGGIEASGSLPGVRAEVERRTLAILEAVGRENPQVVTYLGASGVNAVVLGRIAGERLAPLGFRQLPGYRDPNPYFVRDEQDVEWMKEKLRPEQVWVDATNLTLQQYRDLWGAISFQRQAGLGREHEPAGRPKGSVKGGRAALLKTIRVHPEWSDRQILEAGIGLGAWQDIGAFEENREAYKARVRRAKKAAKRV